MPSWLVQMGPHRFVIRAEDLDAADVELAHRLERLKLERAPAEWIALPEDQAA